ncbi:MAG: 50S ribosomal protein L11 methyltransferase [Magnetococcales bacterium]|nr:50S ribosomal protein L11 methyltransferase [Magnetococcales bacterium]NGZ05021.1 50S ribosomal protein L11 methyltransferase [Magnetococcales bacterium]
MTWELQLHVEMAFEEVVADCLLTEGSMGVSTAVAQDRLLMSGYFAPEADRHGIEIRLMLALAAVGWVNDASGVVWRWLEERDWSESWKESYHPLAIGQGLLILPSWLPVPLGEERRVLRMDPEMAFGSGTHATTRGCLELLEVLAAERPLGRVLDMGTGSGVLAIWAALLGAEHVVATDLDPVAVETAQRNGQLNGVAERLAVIESAEVPSGRYGTIVANILAAVLLQTAPALAAALKPGGALILSGILRDQARDVQLAYEGEGLILQRTLLLEEWAVLLLTSQEGA